MVQHVDDLGGGGGGDQVEVEHGGQRQHQEGAGAGPDEPVVEADAEARQADRGEDSAWATRARSAGAVPKAGRRITKAATASSTTMITGLQDLGAHPGGEEGAAHRSRERGETDPHGGAARRRASS